ncbi:WXG100 family type VII secretion target [Brachybacterium timonense]|uniref:WXG100 family type VII secretion target n=1 Tax=Brachybacterium timonense TaxID=2050896 RepID=UPI00110DF12D|nr:hypothetical protein [Brachybacterium timonense]
MSGFMGADTEQLRNHAELLRDRATAISDLRGRLEPLVMNAEIWVGPDADTFRDTWMSRTAAELQERADRITQWGADLDTQAEEQDDASAEGGSIFGGVQGSGEGQAKSPWDILKDLAGGALGVYNKLQGLFNKGKKAWDFINMLRKGADIGDLLKKAFDPGKAFSGLAGKLAGMLGIPTGFGNKNFFGWVDDLAAKSSFLTKAAPMLGKALPVVDVLFGGHQMIDSIKNGDTFHAITGGAQALGGGLMIAGGALSSTGVGAVVGGPLLAAGAVVSGAGALADVGKMAYDNWDSISSTASNVWNGAGDMVSGAASTVADVASDAGNAIADGVSGAWDAVFG